VLLTAFGDHEQIILVGWAGAAAYCAKDIDPKQLVQTVKAVVNVKFVIENRVFNQKEFDYWINDEIWRKRVSFAASQAALSTHFLSAKRCT
jgi:DNA-binding NarL/FixJ family response regulator